MALISCPECGRSISDKALSCPNCGCPIEHEPEYTHFTLKRDSKAFFCAVKYEVYLDYQLWGIMKNGESLSTSLSCGTHHLKLIDKNNFNKIVYDNDFVVDEDGLTLSFSASMNLKMRSSKLVSSKTIPTRNNTSANSNASVRSQPSQSNGITCPRCGGHMMVQTVAESRKTGCGTILLYIILAISILGWLILIPLLLRRKTESAVYSVCQTCGYRRRLSGK